MKQIIKRTVFALMASILITSCSNDRVSDNTSNITSSDVIDSKKTQFDSKYNDHIISEESEEGANVKIEENEEVPSVFQSATVIRVVDGDTAIVNVDGSEFKLRFIGVDTPETVHPSKPVEYYGKEASNFTKDILFEGREIYLEKDVSDLDRYGRMLRYIWLELPEDQENPSDFDIENKMFNAILVKNGYAQVSTFPPDVKYQDRFVELERIAKGNDLGLWEDGGQSVENENATESISIQNGKIKGNKNSMVYHMPDGLYYNSVSENNTIYFETEEDAINAGYRKAKK